MLSPSLVAVATFLLNIAFNAVLVGSIGFRGAPLATTLSRTVQFLMLAAAVWWHERRQARALRDKEESQGLLEASADVQEGADGWVVVPLETSHKGSGHATPADDASVRAAATAAAAAGEGQAKVVGQATGLQATGDVTREPCGGDSGSAGAPGAKEDGVGHAAEQAAVAAAASPGSHVEQASSHAAAAHSQPCEAPGAQRTAPESERARLLRPETDSSSSDPAPPDDSTSLALAVHSEPPGPEPPSPGSLWRRVQDECKAAVQPAVVTRFLRLGIPGGLSLAFEAGSFDVTTVMAGRLGATATAAHAAMLSIITLTYLACPFALATAGAIRVGNLLGAGQPEGAKRAGAVVVALSGGFMLLMAIGILASRHVLGYAFSSDPQVVEVMADIAIFGALFQVREHVFVTCGWKWPAALGIQGQPSWLTWVQGPTVTVKVVEVYTGGRVASARRTAATTKLPCAGGSYGMPLCGGYIVTCDVYAAFMTFPGVGRPHGEQPGCATRVWPPDPDRHLQLCG